MINKLNTIIADDEPLALSLLSDLLAQHDSINIVAECRNGRQVIEKCSELQPDLLLLDIQMPALSGIDVVEKLQGDITPMVVFVTAYDQFAIKAFEVNAIDYLLKPINSAKLERAIRRCEQVTQIDGSNHKQHLLDAVHSLRKSASSSLNSKQVESKDSNRDRIVVKDGAKVTLLEQAKIDWIDAAGDYVCIHSEGVTHIMRQTMKGINDLLDPNLFARVHRSTIVNLARVKHIHAHSKGEYLLDLGTAERIKVSRNYRQVIKDFLNRQNS